MSKRERRRQDRRAVQEGAGSSRKLALGAGLTVGATLVAGGTAEASTFQVTTLADTGSGSLRDAIDQANANAGSGDGIFFASSISGTINLAGDLPTITDDTYIYDPYGTDRITVNGNGNGIFDINMAPTAVNYSVYLGEMTLTDGSTTYGGAIDNHDAFTLAGNMRFTANNADYGGAIYDNPGSATSVFASTLSGNHATSDGGAWVSNSSYSTAYASTFTGNTAGGDGGAIMAKSAKYYDSFGYLGGNVSLENSTISGNSADSGGGFADEQRDAYYRCNSYDYYTYNAYNYFYCTSGYTESPGYTDLFTTTFSGNTAVDGGGVYENLRSRIDFQPYSLYGSYPYFAFVGDSIVANSNGSADLDGTFLGAFDLIENEGGASLYDEVGGSIITGVDPQLSALANFGGSTETQAIAVTSPALDQGGSTSEYGDQRYATRPVDIASVPNSATPYSDGTDMGAFELQAAEFAAGTAAPPGGGGGGATPPSNQFSFGKLKLNKKKGTAKLPVNVPGAGTLTAAGGGVVKQRQGRISTVVNKVVSAAGQVKLLIKAKGKKKKQLNKTGKVTVKPSITFTPNGGTAKSQKKTVRLKKTL